MSKSKGNNITYNNFKANMMGIGLDQSSDNLILNNIISFNRETGMWIGESSNNTIIGNIISSCADYGIFIRTVGSKNNIIFHNNFEYNQVNANDIGNNTWDDGYPSGGNYWGDYTGEDVDGDGIGDTPYPIPGGDNVDNFPLMELWENHPPETPEIEGKRRFKEGEGGIYPYTIYSTDINGDDICYLINWGDGTQEWTDYYASKEEITINVTIPLEKGTYVIFKIKAKDIFGAVSDWATLEVTIPRNRATHTSCWLRFINMFPILKKLLDLKK